MKFENLELGEEEKELRKETKEIMEKLKSALKKQKIKGDVFLGGSLGKETLEKLRKCL